MNGSRLIKYLKSTSGVLVKNRVVKTAAISGFAFMAGIAPLSANAACVTATNAEHDAAGRASCWWGTCYVGMTSIGGESKTTSLDNSSGSWKEESSCSSSDYTVTASISGASGGTVNPGTATVAEGDTQSITITKAEATDEISIASNTCGGSLSGNTFTTAAVTQDCAVVFALTEDSATDYAVTFTLAAGGSLASPVTNPKTVSDGSVLQFDIDTDLGKIVDTVTSDNSTNCPVSVIDALQGIYQIDSVTGACNINVTFKDASASVSAGGYTLVDQGNGDNVRPNIVLGMDDSFLMNSEVLWTSASGRSEITSLTKANLSQMFVNRMTMVYFTSGTSTKVPGYDYEPPAGYYGAGKKAASIKYNMLAYDPNVIYTPWPGYPSKNVSACNTEWDSMSTYDQASNTTTLNANCPKWYPEFGNDLEGNVTGMNASVPGSSVTTDTKHSILHECTPEGCTEFIRISPDDTHGLEMGYPGEGGVCGYLSTYKLGGNRGDCVKYHYRSSIWENPSTWGTWAAAPSSGIEGCNTTMLSAMGPNPAACFNFNVSTGKWDGGMNAAFTLTCNTQFEGKFNWPCAAWVSGKKYTNILGRGELESQYYVDIDGSTVVYVASLNAAQLNNYANWFTYYRTRGHVQKAAMLKAAYEAKNNDRMGLVDSTGAVVTVNALGNGANGTHRDTLFATVATKRASFAKTTTDTLTTLANIGDYYKANKGLAYESLAETAADDSANCRQNHAVLFASSYWTDAAIPANSAYVGGGVGGNALSNVAAFWSMEDMFADIGNDAPDPYKNQHIKTWVIQFDVDTANNDYDYESYSGLTRPGSTSGATTEETASLKRNDISYASSVGKGAYRKVGDASEVLQSAQDLYNYITAGVLVPAVSDCASGNNSDTPKAKRVSWKELKRK